MDGGRRAPGRGTDDHGIEVDAAFPPVPAWKRVFDCVGIVLSLPISLPLGLVIAGWIKVVSRGPVFFRQVRIGRVGNDFRFSSFEA